MNAGADKSLRIAMLGWAWPPLGPREGSGMNLNVGELAAGLVARGHRVAYLRAGVTYSIRPGVRVHRHDSWRGVELFDVANAPNLASANFNFRNPRAQVRESRTMCQVMVWLDEWRPDVVHIHSMEGFGFDLIHAIVGEDVPVVLTPHNYYALCPQIDLFRRESRICDDYRGGEACVGCLNAPDPVGERTRRRLSQSLARVRSRGGLAGALAGVAERTVPLLLAPPTGRPTPEPAGDAREAERALLASRGHSAGTNAYAERRRAGIGALNACAAILCPSACLLDVHRAMGVEAERLRLVRLGQPHFDAVHAAASALAGSAEPRWTPETPRPLRLAFYGNTHPNKGIGLLADAIERLPAPIAARAEFVIRAGASDQPWRARLSRLACVRFEGAYAPEDLPAMVGEADVGLFPNQGLDNSPFVVLEHLHAGRFTLASDVGGPRGLIVHGRNGLLIPAQDPAVWAEAIASLVEGRVRIPSIDEIHRASTLTTHAQHVGEVEAIYREFAGTRT